jgi:hypothetical protein
LDAIASPAMGASHRIGVIIGVSAHQDRCVRRHQAHLTR